jgi:hypothetical protein
MRSFFKVALLVLLFGCGRTQETATSQESDPEAGVESTAATPVVAPTAKLPQRNAVPIESMPERPLRGLRQASYRTTVVELQDGRVLDSGAAELVIDTTARPLRAWLSVEAFAEDLRVSGKLRLSLADFLAGNAEVPRADLGASALFLHAGGNRPTMLPLARVELTRLKVESRRSRILLRAFDADDALLATLTTQFELNCLTLSDVQPALASSDSAPAQLLTSDTELTSELCQPFATLL